MENKDILIRLRYALDIKNNEMVEIFKLGGIEVTKEEVIKMLSKDTNETEELDNSMLESFFNGLIIFKRGKKDPRPGEEGKQNFEISKEKSINNLLLKRVKSALAFTSEDMIEILGEAGVSISKGELSAVLRKEGHRNYRECGDRYARNFLKGLTLRYRK